MSNSLLDNQILELIADGDHQAFHELFRRHYAKLCSFANQVCNDSQQAEDIVQDFFLNLWHKRDQIIIKYTFKAYAYRSVHNATINYYQRNKFKHVELQPDDTAEAFAIPDNGLDYEEREHIYSCLELAVEELPKQCRKIFKLIYFENHSYAQAASQLGLSINTIKVQMNRAYTRIREQFEKDHKIYASLLFLLIYLLEEKTRCIL